MGPIKEQKKLINYISWIDQLFIKIVMRESKPEKVPLSPNGEDSLLQKKIKFGII